MHRFKWQLEYLCRLGENVVTGGSLSYVPLYVQNSKLFCFYASVIKYIVQVKVLVTPSSRSARLPLAVYIQISVHSSLFP